VRARHVITCAGTHADRVAQSAGGGTYPKVVPFRGMYYQLKPEYRHLIRQMNIYPAPGETKFYVGIHFTPTVNERRGHGVIIGPSACIAFGRESYSLTQVSLRDLWGAATNLNLWKFVLKHPAMAAGELYRDVNRAAFVREAQKLVPELTEDMVEESFAGVMVQVRALAGDTF
jgi:2-hydroxyglutarate dehydrogenase